MTATEFLSVGWRLIREGLAQSGMHVPDTIEFQIDGANHIRATRVAKLEDLAKAIGALADDIDRLSHGLPSVIPHGDDIEQLRREKTSLLELQKRARRSGCDGSATVVEALFPNVPVKKKTEAEKAEIERWLAIRKEEALKIDPETAEVDWTYAQTLDPYGVFDDWELPEEFHQVGRENFARCPGSDIWVEFGDLPPETREKLWNRHRHKVSFPAGLEHILS